MAYEPMIFDDPIIEIEVRINGKDYILREADGGAAIFYRDSIMAAMVTNADGKIVGWNGLAKIESAMVARCLYEVSFHPKSGERILRPVKEEDVKRFPSDVQSALYARIKEISELEEESSEEAIEKEIERLQKKLERLRKGGGDPAKNEPEDTLDGSE